jgi:hypothetical protein
MLKAIAAGSVTNVSLRMIVFLVWVIGCNHALKEATKRTHTILREVILNSSSLHTPEQILKPRIIA